MTTKKAYLIGHSSPSGMSWLDNCLLELGVKVFTINNNQNRWTEEDGYFRPSIELGRKTQEWLPVLNKKNRFKFRPDIEVETGHDWNEEKFFTSPVILFVRHPMDALYSSYKRFTVEMKFSEYVNTLDHVTCLNKIDEWCLFHKAWLNHDNLKVIKFEEYKKNSEKTLCDALEFIGVSYSADLIAKACEESSFAKAKEAEKKFRDAQVNKFSSQDVSFVVNRSGEVGGWRKELTDEGDLNVNRIIEGRAHDVLLRLGYSPDEGSNTIAVDYAQHVSKIKFFDGVSLNKEDLCDGRKQVLQQNPVEYVTEFANNLDYKTLTQAKYFDWQTKILLTNLVDYLEELEENHDYILVINKLLKLRLTTLDSENEKLQNICKERLELIGNLERSAKERLELINTLNDELKRLNSKIG